MTKFVYLKGIKYTITHTQRHFQAEHDSICLFRQFWNHYRLSDLNICHFLNHIFTQLLLLIYLLPSLS